MRAAHVHQFVAADSHRTRQPQGDLRDAPHVAFGLQVAQFEGARPALEGGIVGIGQFDGVAHGLLVQGGSQQADFAGRNVAVAADPQRTDGLSVGNQRGASHGADVSEQVGPGQAGIRPNFIVEVGLAGGDHVPAQPLAERQALAPARLPSRAIWIYIKRWFQGGTFYESHGDDTSQLGGDFIVDKDGVLRLVYPSHDPADRPPVDDLLKVLRNL